MSKNEKPSRIWVTVNGARSVFPGGETYLIGGWESQPREHGTEYVRADIASDMLAALKEAHSALDRALGDTDISYIETDEELRAEEPIQWAAMRIFNAIAKAETPGTSRD